jgi:hypothetical protein
MLYRPRLLKMVREKTMKNRSARLAVRGLCLAATLALATLPAAALLSPSADRKSVV